MYICVYGASSRSVTPNFIQASESLGEYLAEHGHSLVFGAGNAGVMGATARGFHRKGGEIIGVAPDFFNVDGVLFPHCTRLLRTDTMRERKALLEHLSDAFVVAPGGIGTYDELFEILTLKQLERHNKPVIFFNPDGFYDGLLSFLDYGISHGFMKPASKKLFSVCATPEEVLTAIETYVPVELALSELKDVDLLSDD